MLGRLPLRGMPTRQVSRWVDRFVDKHTTEFTFPTGETAISFAPGTRQQMQRLSHANAILERRAASYIAAPSIPLVSSFNNYPAAMPSFDPGDGTPGGMGNAGASFARGLGRLGDGADYSIAPGAAVDPRFSSGAPGIYVVRMIVEGVKLTQETTALHQTGPYNDSLRAQGLNATVTKVQYVENRNPRSANWASDLLTEVFSGDAATGNAIADMVFDVTVRIDPTESARLTQANPDGMNGLGVVQIGAGAVLAIVAVIAVVLAVTFPGFGKMVLEGVRFVGNVAGAIVGGAAGAVAENAVPIILVVGIGAAAIWMLRKGGARYSKGSGFSFGG